MKTSIQIKKRAVFLLTIFALNSCNNQVKNEKEIASDSLKAKVELNEDLTYDADLAKKYGADDYGMKKYVIAYLKRGPNRNQDSATRAELQRAHLNNIGKMAEEGKLVLAGPFLDDDDVRGIYIFNVETIEEAEVLTNTDPAIIEGSLVMELRPWYGSAALMGLNNLHQKISKQQP